MPSDLKKKRDQKKKEAAKKRDNKKKDTTENGQQSGESTPKTNGASSKFVCWGLTSLLNIFGHIETALVCL